MFKLVDENNNIHDINEFDECSRMEVMQAKEQKKTRMRYLEIEIEQEREHIIRLEKQLQKGKENILISLILFGISIAILMRIRMDALSIVITMFQQPLVGAVIIGILVKFVAYTINHIRTNVPMFIWCEMERKGMNVKHDNLFRQYKQHNNICNAMEEELHMLLMDRVEL